MKIFVISLPTSFRRRRSIERQFARLGVGFRFFDAVTPVESVKHVAGYDESEFVLNCGRAATATEIACYASHLALWRRCADEGSPFLILEDDARLGEDFIAGLASVMRQIGRLGFVRVSMPELTSSTVIGRDSGFDFHFCRRVPLLALAYCIAPSTAQRLAECGDTVEEPVDKYLQRYWRHERPVFAVMPPVVHLTALADESDIGPRRRPRQTAQIRLRRAARKAANSVARTVYAALLMRAMNHTLKANQPKTPTMTTPEKSYF